MPRFLLLIEEGEERNEAQRAESARRIQAWIGRGRDVGVVQGHVAISEPRLRVERGGGVTVVVAGAPGASVASALVFEAEDEPSALSWASGCPGEGTLSVLRLDDTSERASFILGP